MQMEKQKINTAKHQNNIIISSQILIVFPLCIRTFSSLWCTLSLITSFICRFICWLLSLFFFSFGMLLVFMNNLTKVSKWEKHKMWLCKWKHNKNICHMDARLKRVSDCSKVKSKPIMIIFIVNCASDNKLSVDYRHTFSEAIIK